MRELVTLQVGSFANFIGSHFWNFQDEILGLASDPESDQVFRNQAGYVNMDVLYRTGETRQGNPTYTPRLISIDFQGSLGSVSSRGTLYNEDNASALEDVVTWGGPVSVNASNPHKKNIFLQSLYGEEQNSLKVVKGTSNGKNDTQSEIRDEDIVQYLENGVQYWTDYSKVHYHPQSLYELRGLWMDPKDFDNYGKGKDIYSEGFRGEEINERLRFFVEECDNIQGFQFMVDDVGGFSAIAADFLENVADEYREPVLLYTVRHPSVLADQRSTKQTIGRKIHDSVSFSRLSSFCKVIVPLGLPFLSTSKAAKFLCIEDQKPYHSSAVYAAALHSITLPFRIEPLGPTAELSNISGAVDVNGLVKMLAGQARQNTVASLDVAMPTPTITGEQDGQSLLSNLQPLTPEVAENMEDLQAVEYMTIQGAFGSGGQRATASEVSDRVNAAYKHAIARPKFCHLSVSPCPLPIPLPFPSIFGNLVGQHGELLSRSVPGLLSKGSLDVHSVPMAARLRSSRTILPFLENRLESLRRFGIRLGAPGAELIRSWGFGKDELEDMEEHLSNMVTALDPHSQGSSDSD